MKNIPIDYMSTLSQRFGDNVMRLAMIAAMAGLVFTEPASAADSFEQAELRLEQNLTDKDVEVVFSVTAQNSGIAALQVTAPDGRVVIDFKSPDSKFAIRHLTLETPEPANDGTLLADYPEGIYRFNGTTTKGDKMQATATLSHTLPLPVQVIGPRPNQKDVPLAGTKVLWTPMSGIAQFIVILEDGNGGQEVTAKLPGTKTEFSIPAGFLASDGTYKVEIGTVAKNGNRSFVEYNIFTAKPKQD